jgi:hypothetical protein
MRPWSEEPAVRRSTKKFRGIKEVWRKARRFVRNMRKKRGTRLSLPDNNHEKVGESVTEKARGPEFKVPSVNQPWKGSQHWAAH